MNLEDLNEPIKRLREVQNEGVFVAVKFSDDTVQRILNYCEKNEIPNVVQKEDLHCTLIQSKTDVPDFTPQNKLDEIGIPFGVELWDKKTREADLINESQNIVLVLRFECDYLENRFNELIDMGASRKFKTFKPHITLSRDVGNDFDILQLSSVKELGDIEITSEYSEKLEK